MIKGSERALKSRPEAFPLDATGGINVGFILSPVLQGERERAFVRSSAEAGRARSEDYQKFAGGDGIYLIRVYSLLRRLCELMVEMARDVRGRR